MVMGDYDSLAGRVAQLSKISKDEIDRKVETKRVQLSGLISKEGAVQIIAAELGLSLDNEVIKIKDIAPGIKRLRTFGKIIKLFPVREFEKNGRKGKVCNFILADETGNTKIVLWDTNHIALVENSEIKEGDVVEISNATSRDQEIHLNSFSEIKKSLQTIGQVVEKQIINERELKDCSNGQRVKIRGFIVQMFDPKFFEVNSESGKKLTEDELASGVPTVKRALINCTIDDGTENIRSVIFHEQIKQFGIDPENTERITMAREELLGKEYNFSGNIRTNSYFQVPEFIVQNIEEVNIDEIVQKLESK
jgi:hypothetical protein